MEARAAVATLVLAAVAVARVALVFLRRRSVVRSITLARRVEERGEADAAARAAQAHNKAALLSRSLFINRVWSWIPRLSSSPGLVGQVAGEAMAAKAVKAGAGSLVIRSNDGTSRWLAVKAHRPEGAAAAAMADQAVRALAEPAVMVALPLPLRSLIPPLCRQMTP
jgi:hypothetical protein